jgi:FdhD protein
VTDAALERPPSVTVPITTATPDGAWLPDEWHIAVESPVQISVNGTPFTVLLATPEHLDDLALGVLLTERIIEDPRDVLSVHNSAFLQEVTVNVTVSAEKVRAERMGARSMLGNSACGLCGIEALAQLRDRPTTPLGRRVAVTDDAIRAAATALSAWQPLNARTRSVHAAAWCHLDGSIQLVREDVGRHNALDKVIGALAAHGTLHDAGFLLMTSRCSYELVYKAIAANTQLLVSIGAPTSMALHWATALDLPVAALWQQRAAPTSVVRFPSPSSSVAEHAR